MAPFARSPKLLALLRRMVMFSAFMARVVSIRAASQARVEIYPGFSLVKLLIPALSLVKSFRGSIIGALMP